MSLPFFLFLPHFKEGDEGLSIINYAVRPGRGYRNWTGTCALRDG